MGRMKYIRPVYKELVKQGRQDLAKELYEKYKNFYHTLAAKMVAKDIGI